MERLQPTEECAIAYFPLQTDLDDMRELSWGLRRQRKAVLLAWELGCATEISFLDGYRDLLVEVPVLVLTAFLGRCGEYLPATVNYRASKSMTPEIAEALSGRFGIDILDE